jgi:hypothetical protein
MVNLIQNEYKSRIEIINFINKNIDTINGNYLEIGALHNPWLKDHVNNQNLKYLDFTTTEQLKLNYENDPNVNISNIVNVDYIFDPTKLYGEYINERFNIVFSAHNIEHQPDLITHLNNVESVLVNGGYYIILCPDFRYIFDFYRNPTNIIDVLYLKKDKFPNFLTYLEFIFTSNKTSNNQDENFYKWNNMSNQDRLSTQNELINKNFNFNKTDIEKIFNNTNYNDCHVWKFYYQNFIDILTKLNELNYTNFKIELVHTTNTLPDLYEFGIILKKVINE